MKENRTDIRVDVCLTTRWQGCSANHSARISDLSRAGCYVDTIAEVIVGETLFLKILVPDGEWFELTGVVAHHTPRLGFGVRFVDLDGKQHHQIGSLLRLHSPIPVESSIAAECREALIPSQQIDFTSPGIM
jgi:PilZ domain-containing protein